MKTAKILAMLALLLILATSAIGSTQGKMYWTDTVDRKIQCANTDGSGAEDLVTSLTIPGGIALDVDGGKMYWTDSNSHKIHCANLDGSVVEDLVTGLMFPIGIALDVAAGKMYWTDADTDKIQRANLDGSTVEDLVTGLMFPIGIALDVDGGKMYWTDSDAHKIQRANLDGSGAEDLVTDLTSPCDIALDVTGAKMYWTDSGAHKIQCANLDGSGVEDLLTSLPYPIGIALDVTGVKMYWTDGDAHKIQCANLDGSAVEDLLTGLSWPGDIAVVPPIYAFTYQGHLYDNNSVADGLYDFAFKLYDEDSDGNQVGGNVYKLDVDVIDGYFTVELDFGEVFNGEARWLEIGVRPGASTGSFTTLSPRQEVMPTPYAIYAKTAGSVTEVDPIFTASSASAIQGTDITNWNTAYSWGDHVLAGYLTSFSESDPVFSGSTASAIQGTDITNWNTAYGWGDHSVAGYLTSFSESDPVFSGSTASSITAGDMSNWNTAYGWGDHSVAGYLTSFSESDPTVLASVKDGVSWGEVSGIPAGFADGVDDIGGGLTLPYDGSVYSTSPAFKVTNTSSVGGDTGIYGRSTGGGIGPRGVQGYAEGTNPWGLFGSATGEFACGVIGMVYDTNAIGVGGSASGENVCGGKFFSMGVNSQGVYAQGDWADLFLGSSPGTIKADGGVVIQNATGGDTILKVETDSIWNHVYLDLDRGHNARKAVTRYLTAGVEDWYAGMLYNIGQASPNYHIATGPDLPDAKLTVEKATGNVGIGTTSPVEKLEVSGNIRASGYKSSDGSPGYTGDIWVAGPLPTIPCVIHVKNGLITGTSCP